ncbi:MAG: hypothetical protein ACTSXA_13495 [Candidatus Heimdallarchaeota archaeon]
MSEAIAKIPGTTYSLKFGVEGKYYAVYLVQYHHPIETKNLEILKGTSIRELPEAIENGLKFMLDAKGVFINPIVIDRVVNEVLEKIPEDGQVLLKETEPVDITPGARSVSDLINNSDNRAGKKSIIEHRPGEKSPYDASALDIAKKPAFKPKPLPEKVEKIEPATPAVQPKTKPSTKAQENINTGQSIEDNIQTLTDRLVKNEKAVTSLKKQVTTLKKKVKKLTPE